MTHSRKAFSEAERAEIARELKERNSRTDERRLFILQAAEDGKLTTQELAKIFRVSASSISHLITNFRKGGCARIRSRKLGGNRRNMSEEAEKAFLEEFIKQALGGKIIEVSEIRKAYEAKMGRPVSASVVYGLLKRHGWRKIMPRSRHPKKATPEAIESYKKNGREDTSTYENIWFSFPADVSGRGRVWTNQQAETLLVCEGHAT